MTENNTWTYIWFTISLTCLIVGILIGRGMQIEPPTEIRTITEEVFVEKDKIVNVELPKYYGGLKGITESLFNEFLDETDGNGRLKRDYDLCLTSFFTSKADCRQDVGFDDSIIDATQIKLMEVNKNGSI